MSQDRGHLWWGSQGGQAFRDAFVSWETLFIHSLNFSLKSSANGPSALSDLSGKSLLVVCATQ